jgi:hypothetical protein
MRPHHPRSEPEIIPPDRGEARSHVWVWVSDQDGMRHATIRPPGPLSIFLILALFALVVTVVLAVFLGAVLFWIPVLILLIGAGLVAAAVRRHWLRFRYWLLRR